VFQEYLRTFGQPDTIHAICEDYRAAASIDLAHDDADLDKKIHRSGRRSSNSFRSVARTYILAGPDSLTGEAIAAIWSEALGRPIRYGGDDLTAMEQRLKKTMPAWHALDLRLMMGRYQSDGAVATADDMARLTALLGHAPRSYRDFAKDAAAQWAKG
jgi:uncharacterized protein YbjT (DUF2867 family)